MVSVSYRNGLGGQWRRGRGESTRAG